jgi:hypothetical protein
MKKNHLWLWILGILLIVVAVGYGFLQAKTYQPMAEAFAALDSEEAVIVETNPTLSFLPRGQEVKAGLVLYPGGLVNEVAYSPLGKALALRGIAVFIPTVPLKLAVLAPNSAQKIITDHPEIYTWYTGGHSLGGVMAAQYAAQHPEDIKGLVLLASYPLEKYSLKTNRVKVLSLIGSLDGFVNMADIEKSKAFMPDTAIIQVIQGGNHSQMGWYGFQKGDKEATVSREEQQGEIVEAVVGMVEK